MGFDAREAEAYNVARKSILGRSKGVEVLPLRLYMDPVKSLLRRPIERKDGKMWCPISQAPMATEFAISRFCVPFIQKEGFALFVDCDIVCLADINELFNLADDKYAVQVVKREHTPTESVKMDGQVQTQYPRKNWSSMVLWNCSHPANKRLTLKELNGWPGRDLHAFRWLLDDEIGALPPEWNHLVGVDPVSGIQDFENGQAGPMKYVVWAKLLHFTNGGPWIKGWQGGPLDDVWLREAGDSREL